MASLVSPGVSVTITNESFFIPAQATTVPLFFIATSDEKTQANGVTAAAGTYESNVVETITSLTQSTQLYGVPNFLTDSAGNPQHGDARNEYGLFALNQFLGVGSMAYVVRANVNLNDSFASIQQMWDNSMTSAAYVLENTAQSYINSYNTANNYTPSSQAGVLTLGTITGGSGYPAGVYTNVPLTGGSGVNAVATITISGGVATLGGLVAGSGYTPGVYSNVVLTGGTGTGARANITVSAGIITSTGAIVGGNLYTDGVYTNVPLTGGAGSGAMATITISAGAVTSVVLTSGGVGYSAGNTLTAIPASLGGLGSGFTTTVAAVKSGVTSVSLASAGTGYSTGNTLTAFGNGIATVGAITAGTLYTDGTYTNVPLTGGSGSGATASVVVSGGSVTGVTITNPGTGYVIADVLSAAAADIGGTGSGFDVAVATVGTVAGTGFAVTVASESGTGPVTSVVITSGGMGYTVSDGLSALMSNLGGAGSGFIVPVATVSTSNYKTTLTSAELTTLITQATAPVWKMFSFRNSSADFFANWTLTPLGIYSNGFTGNPVGTGYLGIAGILSQWVSSQLGSVPPHTGWTPTEAYNTLLGAADQYKFTTNFLNQTSLGLNDAARRTSIVSALNACIVSNTDIRSEQYEYNLILCPGYPEVVANLVNLSLDIQEEAMVIGDAPFDATPDSVVTWGATSARVSSPNVAYYYPHGLGTNLDGESVFVAASGTALRTITYSDSISNVWFAPAGTTRGVVTSITNTGYVSGTLGSATTFVPVALNVGQRDNMYKYFTNLNPIVYFPGRGIIIWGQKSSAPTASALDRINVVRLMMYIKRALRKSTMPFVFEPNDSLTQGNLKAMVDGFLGDLITKRGLYDYATVCDSSNNTPTRVDANELYIDIALKPVKAAEFIHIPIRIVATGATLANA